MGSPVITVFDGSKPGVTYTITSPAVGASIRSTDFTTMVAAYNAEFVRRNHANPNYTVPTGQITASTLKAVPAALNALTGQGSTANSLGNPGTDVSATTISQYNQTAAFNGAGASATPNLTSGLKFYSSDFTALAKVVKDAGAACLCNCNYCTCNCNYSCTCNCNYSDARLKENIIMINTESELNVYSYTYLWNKTKTYIGVLAQELLGTKYESALGKDSNGYYYVDYSKLPVTFKEV